MPDQFHNQGTDFHSLMKPEALPADAGAGLLQPGSAEFEALAARNPNAVPRLMPRTAADYLIDAVTPCLVFLMVFSVVWFLLDVRFIFTEVQDRELRIFGICMVMGVVALNRLVARNGSEESFLYIVGLFAAVIVFTYMSTSVYGMGSVARGFLDNPVTATFLNFAVVAFLWWQANRLTHECCVDTNPHAGDVGLLTSFARDFQRRSRETAPKAATKKRPFLVQRPKGHVLESMEIEPYDPTEWKPPEQSVPQAQATMAERPTSRHPGMSVFYFSVPVMIAFAFGLPVLMQGGPGMVLAGHLYVGVYTISALLLLLLSSMASLREYFRSRRVYFPGAIGWWWIGLGLTMVLLVTIGAVSMPMPPMPQMAYIDEHELDFWTRGSTFQLQSPSATLATRVQQSEIIAQLQVGVFFFLGVVALYGGLRGLGELGVWMGRNRHRFPKPVVRFFQSLDALLERVLKVPRLPTFRRRRRLSAEMARSTKYRNPMAGQARADADSVRAAVAASYNALCALAEDVGEPKAEDMTPYEFLEVLPRELHGLREEARELAELYVRSEYSDVPPDERVLDRLRKFWLAYERVRAGLIK